MEKNNEEIKNKENELHNNPDIKQEEKDKIFVKKMKILLVIGLTAFLLAGIFFFIITDKPGHSSGSSDDDSTSMAFFIPIWTAIFIPIIAAKRKKEGKVMTTTKQKKVLMIILGLTTLLVGLTVFFVVMNRSGVDVDDFESCVNAGNPVLESHPRQCKTSQGEMFVENLE